MVDIQSPTSENKQGKKEDRKKKERAKIQWPALFHRVAIKIH